MLVEVTLRFLGFVAGGALHLFLVVLLARKAARSLAEQLLLLAVISAGLWHSASAIAFFLRINTGLERIPALDFLDWTAAIGRVVTPALLLHLAVVWSRRKPWAGALGYAAVPAGLWLLGTERLRSFDFLSGAMILAAAGFFALAASQNRDEVENRFFNGAAATLAIAAAGVLIGGDSAIAVWSSLAPVAAFAYFVYRHDFLGLLISRKLVFALILGIVSALYLFLVRRVADFAEEAFDFLGPLTEVTLILAAALIWLPLYAWMNRFFAKRTQLIADFSKSLIEEAAGILDLRARVQFLAEEVGRTFKLRRALLVTTPEPRAQGRYGLAESQLDAETIDKVEAAVRQERAEIAHTHRGANHRTRVLLSDTGFNYLFPLWYKGNVIGLLFLDTYPRVYLDQEEDLLLGLCRQISHSIETCRVVEEKIGLEKTLLRQEQLARLGAAAAAIAHEVRNPLSSIKALAQLMNEDPEVKQRYARDLGYMISEIDRLNSSVQQLLAFARPVPEVKTEINLTRLLETTTEMLSRVQASDGVVLRCRAGPGLTLQRSNPELLQQTVLNLVLNAVQASKAGQLVEIEAEPKASDKVVIRITDEGLGIPKDVRERIFEPFFTTKQQGTGLGLAIVRKNVRQMGGEIEVESPVQNERGTRITLTLPVS